MPEAVSQETTALSEAVRLMQDGRFDLAVGVLGNAVEQGATLDALCMLAASYLELGENDRALHYASAAVEMDPCCAPARDVVAKVHVALEDYVSALSDFDALAALSS